MRYLICVMTMVLFACSVEPEPLVYGKDQCHTCKMTLMDRKFGAELVTKKGKVYKFDDINCLFSFYNNGTVEKTDYQYVLIVDFTKPEKLINAENAIYLKSESIKSPMASGCAALEIDNPQLTTQLNAIQLSWQEIQNEFSK